MFPGCPSFGFGHNGALAWGCTTGFRDAWDLYRIHRLPDDPTRYRTPDGSGAITHHREELPARFGRRVAVEWEACEHGILYPGWRHHDGTELAVRVVPCDLAELVRGLRRAGGVADGRRAPRRADAHARRTVRLQPRLRPPRRPHRLGALRARAAPAARRPLRARRARSGRRSGTAGCRSRRCRSSSIRSAASSPRPTRRPTRSAPPSSPRRTASRATARPASRRCSAPSPRHTVESFAALQRDVVCRLRAGAARRLLALCDGAPVQDGARALDVLRAWDGSFGTRLRRRRGLFALVQHDLPRRLFVPLLGTRPRCALRQRPARHAAPARAAARPRRPAARRPRARRRAPAGDDRARGRSPPSPRGSRRAQGPEPSRWRWGEVHRVWLGTRLGLLPRARAAASSRSTREFPGDEYTVSPSRALPVPRPALRLRRAPPAASSATCRGPTRRCSRTPPVRAPIRIRTFFAGLSKPWHRFEYFRSALWRADEVPDPVERVVIG